MRVHNHQPRTTSQASCWPRFILVVITIVLFLASPLPTNNLNAQSRDRLEDHFSTRLMHRQKKGNRGRNHRGNERELMRFRTIDGSYNNLSNPTWGVANTNLWRRVLAEYADGISEPARQNMPSPREISNLVCGQVDNTANQRGLTDMVWQWGQFLDHDIDLTETHEELEFFPIQVPAGDPWFDPNGTGEMSILFFRSAYNPFAPTDQPRQQLNFITSWIDGSNVYGSDEETANSLRLFRNGRMRVTVAEDGSHLLPMDDEGFFLAGDVRANEQVYLTAMHTLFVREHNRIARQIKERNPNLNDEEIYQLARKRVVATLQAITYNEFLPALLGPNALPKYRGYNARVFPNIANTFSTGAFRFGHSMLNSELLRLDRNLNVIPAGNLALRDAFFSPEEIVAYGIEPYLIGLASQQAQEIDSQLVDDVRNFLFGAPGSGGFDLAALNIQRGRDHGLANINSIRQRYGLLPFSDFSDLTSDQQIQQSLEELYGDIENVDPWVAMLCEDHFPNSSLGETAWFVLQDQFRRLRDGDRFWYEIQYRGRGLQNIRETRLSDVILRNTKAGWIRRDLFTMPGF